MEYCSIISWSWDKEIETQSIEIEKLLDDVFNVASLWPSDPCWTSMFPSPLPSRYDEMGNHIPPKILKETITLPQRIYVATHAKLPDLLRKPITGLDRKVRNLTEHRAIRCRIRAFELHGTFRQPVEKSRVMVPDDDKKIITEETRLRKGERKGRLRRWCRS